MKELNAKYEEESSKVDLSGCRIGRTGTDGPIIGELVVWLALFFRPVGWMRAAAKEVE